MRLRSSLPQGDKWIYELKLDGYRTLGIKSEGVPKVVSRNRKGLSARFSDVEVTRARLPEETVIDGEVVALDETGLPSFGALQNGSRGTMLWFFAFDLLFTGGPNAQKRPIERNGVSYFADK